jgi:5-methylcytosine-specific restriction endonuclease McrA
MHNMPHTEESKAKMSASKMGVKLTIEHKQNISKSCKGKQLSLETRGKMSRAKKGIIFSLEHRRKLSEIMKRRIVKNNNNWKGGISSKNHRIRTSTEYQLWRTSVFERDNYTCIWCGTKSGNGKTVILNADHIKPFYQYPELRFAIDNGRTLCEDCHRTTETWGRPKKIISQ